MHSENKFRGMQKYFIPYHFGVEKMPFQFGWVQQRREWLDRTNKHACDREKKKSQNKTKRKQIANGRGTEWEEFYANEETKNLY